MSIVYYAGMALILLVLVTKAQTHFLPLGIAKQIGHNSESFALGLAVAATIQFARPRWLTSRGVVWGLVLAVAAVWILLALGVYYLGLPSSIKTLNEPLAGAGVLTVYLGAKRPLPRAWLMPLITAVVVVVAYHLRLVQSQAEAVTAVVAVSISTDLTARSILLPRVRETAMVWGWYAFLAVWPALMLFLNHQDLPGVLGDGVNYMARGAEGFWGALLICLYFGVLRRVEQEPAQNA